MLETIQEERWQGLQRAGRAVRKWCGRLVRAGIVFGIAVLTVLVIFPATVIVGRALLSKSIDVGREAGVYVEGFQFAGWESLARISVESLLLIVPGAIVLVLAKSLVGDPVKYFKQVRKTLRKAVRYARRFVVGGGARDKSTRLMQRSSLLLAAPFVLLGIGGIKDVPPVEETVNKIFVAVSLWFEWQPEPQDSDENGAGRPPAASGLPPSDPVSMPKPTAHVIVGDVKEVEFGEPHEAESATFVQVMVGPGGREGQHAVVCGYVGSSSELRAVAAVHYGFATPNPVSTFSMLVEGGSSWSVDYCSTQVSLPRRPKVRTQEISVGLDWPGNPSDVDVPAGPGLVGGSGS